jgi:hypothetical protein
MPFATIPPRLSEASIHGRATMMLETDRAVILNTDFFSLMRVSNRTENGGDCHTQQRFRERFRMWTCAWLDVNTTIHTTFEQSLLRVGGWCDQLAETVPIAITVVAGREGTDAKNKMDVLDTDRGGFIARTLDAGRFRRFITDNEIEYLSGGGCKMLLVLGRLALP